MTGSSWHKQRFDYHNDQSTEKAMRKQSTGKGSRGVMTVGLIQVGFEPSQLCNTVMVCEPIGVAHDVSFCDRRHISPVTYHVIPRENKVNHPLLTHS